MAGGTAVLRLGAHPSRARVLCVLVHGRTQTPEDMEALVVGRLSAPGVAFALPRSEGRSWYDARAVDPLTEGTERQLLASLDQLGRDIADLRRVAPDLPLLLAGFSQGACLGLEHLLRRGPWNGALAALTGGRVGRPGDAPDAQPLDGFPVYLTGGDRDPWIPAAAFGEASGMLGQAGARLRAEVFPGRPHEVSAPEVATLDALLADLAAGRPPFGDRP
jgi:phospholipase/carboxylesterase